jgi:hypothetical protein
MCRASHNPSRASKAILVFLLCCGVLANAAAASWNEPTEQLARKIVAITGPGAVGVTVENRSSLSKKDFDAIRSILRVNLEALGARPAQPDQSAASAVVWLSENPRFYVWVAEIHQGAAESTVVIVTVPRADEADLAHDSMPMSLRKIPLWAQEGRILDVLVLQEDNTPRQIAVLDGERVAIYRSINSKWQQEQSLSIMHVRPWPRDLRGRMLAARDHLLEVYLPGVFCRSTTTLPLALTCHESDDPWPLVAPPPVTFSSFGGAPAVPALGAFFSTSRNFFTGALAPGVGRLTAVGKFYSAAPLLRDKYVLWLFAGTDGQVHLVDGVTDQVAKLEWGSDVASVKTACGSGWLVLATGEKMADRSPDSVRAYEIADRDPVPVSAGLDLSGEITALWTEAKGESAVAVVRNRETGDYEAFRLAVACSQ